jgi:DtxR family Mn-dependent transcriptional regulator
MEEKYDELLECIWTLREQYLRDRVSFMELPDVFKVEELLLGLEKEECIERIGGFIRLTARGEEKAERLIRNHRLAECLFTELFQIEESELEETACKFEHILSPSVTESVCIFLGHPPVCPHGRRIPPGECCRKGTRKIKPLVSPLFELEPGRRGRIMFITPGAQKRLERLMSLGIMPGARVRLLQKNPSVVMKVDETTVALEAEIAKEIYIKPDVE